MTSTELAQYRTEAGNVIGLDEIDAADMVSPRFAIDHNRGVWVNSLTKMEYTGFTAILLARVKQRIMWKAKLEDKSDPQCRSNNFNLGFPNQNPKSKTADLFPWPNSVFNPADYPAIPEHNNLAVLPCANCDFKTWKGDDKPACKEQWTFAALIFLASPAAPEGEWSPALLTIQGTGLSSIRPYISTFIQRQSPLFTQMTDVTLKSEMKGNNEYFVPIFKPGAGTDPESWNGYSQQTGAFVDFLKQDPRPYERDEDAPAIAPAPTQQAPAIAPVETPAAAPVAETLAEIAPEPAVVPVETAAPAPAAAAVSTPAPAVAQPAAAAAAPAAPAVAAPAPAAPAQPAPAPAAAPAPAPAPAAVPAPTPAPAAAPEPAPAPPAAAPAPPVAAAPAPAAPAAGSPQTVAPGKLPF